MIKDGDRIAVGVSGGKDSILLLYALTLYRQYMKVDYELYGVTVDLGFPGFNLEPVRAFLRNSAYPTMLQKRISQKSYSISEKSPTPVLCARKCARAHSMKL